MAAVISSMGFVVWLVYAELFLIHTICLWCTVAHVLAFSPFALIVLYSTQKVEGGKPLRDQRPTGGAQASNS